MASTHFHEAPESLRKETREMHRAISSLIEELEAVDWYDQRIDASDDDALRRILVHNRDEEKEHAAMTLEWIRRRDPKFDEHLRRFLFRDGPIVGAEEGGAGAAEDDEDGQDSGDAVPSLAIGSLRAEVAA